MLSGERRYWATDQQVREATRTRFFYLMGRPEQRKLILERIEESYGHLEPVDLQSAKLTIEHIMPQTLSVEWRDQLQTAGEDPDSVRDELVHTLGNLTLTAYNGVLSNNPFERKLQIYKDSNLQLNKALKEETVWGRAQILARGEELAEHAIQIWPPPLPGAKGAPIGFDWGRIDAAVAAIPAGRWTTYGDLALLGGTTAQAVGNRMASPAAPATAYRVLDSQGRVRPQFRWSDPKDAREPILVLQDEGLVFGSDLNADPSQRLNAIELADLIDYEFEPEELERQHRTYEVSAIKAQVDADSPWPRNGRDWHYGQMTPRAREILEALLTLLTEITAGVEPSWAQKYYVSWSLGSRVWLAAHPRQNWIWLDLMRPAVTAPAVATRLGWVYVPPQQWPSTKSEGPAQVTGSADGTKISLQLRALGDFSGPTGTALRELLMEFWTTALVVASLRI
jgi:alkylated DNA nucleotide flippase Atl1